MLKDTTSANIQPHNALVRADAEQATRDGGNWHGSNSWAHLTQHASFQQAGLAGCVRTASSRTGVRMSVHNMLPARPNDHIKKLQLCDTRPVRDMASHLQTSMATGHRWAAAAPKQAGHPPLLRSQ